MHSIPNIKRASKLISNKTKEGKTGNLPSWIFKIPTIYMTSGAQCKGKSTISYILAKSFGQKVDSNSREMKINCLIFPWINISCFKNTWNLFLLRNNIFIFLIFSMLLVLVQIRKICFFSHVTSYHYYPLVKTHLYQGYFNMLCYWHMTMCCLIRLRVNMLTLFKKLLTKE